MGEREGGREAGSEGEREGEKEGGREAMRGGGGGDWIGLKVVVFSRCDRSPHGLLTVRRLGVCASRTIQSKLP